MRARKRLGARKRPGVHGDEQPGRWSGNPKDGSVHQSMVCASPTSPAEDSCRHKDTSFSAEASDTFSVAGGGQSHLAQHAKRTPRRLARRRQSQTPSRFARLLRRRVRSLRRWRGFAECSYSSPPCSTHATSSQPIVRPTACQPCRACWNCTSDIPASQAPVPDRPICALDV
jgi:hypothetical protein